MRAVSICLVFLSLTFGAQAQTVDQIQTPAAQREFLQTLAAHEKAAADHQTHFSYLSSERSERTGGHLWSERVIESKSGRVRMLLAEDGKPLDEMRAKAERDRLQYLALHPQVVERDDAAHHKDELKAQSLLELLVRGYLYSNPRVEGKYLLLDFHPDPNYKPQSMEERVMAAMTGTVAVASGSVRVHRLTAHLDQEMSIGFGILATIHAGSSFTTERNEMPTTEWKTTDLDSKIDGRAIFFKTISSHAKYDRTDYHRLPDDLTVAQAVAMLTK
ncbi:hypothetical protein [Terriglobus saanensis]|uniref:Uncharacterized protein n=1 Tax=Terriglobus saanensis (strain ATCC BAA-1853 / DSM 23119 / SP1PR4) TaxID=401053 RepID=E8V712_TERSS|nr:hypothetical protein [Terriglobus saanensis]ADV81652.1 hypothetical protein AciPR4_0819 [Terriglobus saanensis SP1PR4]